MKKQMLKSALIALAGVGLMSGSAMAIPTMKIISGANLQQFEDNDGADQALSTGDLALTLNNFGDYSLQISAGTTMPALGTAEAPEFHLTVAGFLKSTAPITSSVTVMFSETNFGPMASSLSGFLTSLGGSSTGGIEFSVYYSLDNTLFELDNQIDLISLGSGAQAATSTWYDTLSILQSNNFSLTVIGTLKGAGSLDADVDPVPEPATMLLFGTGLLGLAGVARRKQ